jgi:hypothetical protein
MANTRSARMAHQQLAFDRIAPPELLGQLLAHVARADPCEYPPAGTLSTPPRSSGAPGDGIGAVCVSIAKVKRTSPSARKRALNVASPRETPRRRDHSGDEDDFALADGWLLGTLIAAAVQLWRRRASALLWLIAAGAAGQYLLGMDMLYDLDHHIYAGNTGGVIELLIDILVAGASVGVLWWSWRYRWLLLDPPSRRV